MPSDQMLLAEMQAAVHAFDAGQLRLRALFSIGWSRALMI